MVARRRRPAKPDQPLERGPSLFLPREAPPRLPAPRHELPLEAREVRDRQLAIPVANHVIRQNTDRPKGRRDPVAGATNPEGIRALPEAPDGIAPSDGLLDLLDQIEKVIDGEIALDRFLGQINPLGKDIANARAEGVRIMSLASAKGLTVRGTVIAGCEDGIIPREGQSRSEEARLMYVGMTRCREVLYCTWARRRTGPTARAGRARVGMPRRKCGFFDGGPVDSENGDDLVR